MKIAVARGPGQLGGIYRRFRELCAWADGRHEILGLLLLGREDATLDQPVRTLSYARRHLSWRLLRAATIEDVLDGCSVIVDRLARDLARERPQRVLAADTDLKGLCVVAACHRIGLPVTTFVAGLADVEAEHAHGAVPRHVELAAEYCLTQSDRLIFPSRFAAEHCAARFPRLAPWQAVHNGVASAFLDAERADGDSRRVGAVMRLSPVKNPEAIGRIAAALERRGIALEVVTDARGDAAAAEALGCARILAPTLDSERLAALYTGWRAVVSPSRFEASGNVPMEALGSGTPAVVTDRMGVAEILADLGLAHLIVAVDDVETTVERLVEAAPIPPAVRREVRTRYSWPAVCERLVQAL